MLELLFCSLLTVVPDYLFRRYVQGKRLGKEITFYSVWFELRWGITACLILTVSLITVIFYNHPSTSTVTMFFKTVPIISETNGRVAEVYIGTRGPVTKGMPLFKLDNSKQEAAVETARRKIAEIDAQMVVARADVQKAEGQLQEAKSAHQQTVDELETKEELYSRNPGNVPFREIERLQVQAEGRLAAIASATAAKQAAEEHVSTKSALCPGPLVALLSPATRGGRLSRYGTDDPLEIGVRSGIAVDRHMLRHIKLQPLDGPEQRNSVQVDIRRRRSRRRRPVEICIDHDLLLREIRDQHVIGMIEVVDMMQHYASLPVADRVRVRERLQHQRTGTGRRKRELREPVGLQGSRLRTQHDLLEIVLVVVVGDDRRALGGIGSHPAEMIEVVVRDDEIADRLVWDGLLDFRDYGVRARLIRRRLRSPR